MGKERAETAISKPSVGLDADYKRKANARKLELTDDIRTVLIDHFADELRACATLFGGPALAWPARCGL